MHLVVAAASRAVNAVIMPQGSLNYFDRLFFIPGLGHTGLFNALRDWVEKGQGPERIELAAASASLSLPICSHPKKPVLAGPNPNAAASYICR